MYIHSNNDIDKRINVSKIANNINTMRGWLIDWWLLLLLLLLRAFI